jgi:N-acetylglucosamine malate deacetylase 1
MTLATFPMDGKGENMASQGVDFMAIGAHPDDIELGCGGTLLRLASLGRTGVVVDMTDASMGTRGTPAIRAKEAQAAARVLKVQRVNLGLPDARLKDDWETQKKLIEQIRRFRPKVILTHHWMEEHPDHEATSRAVKEACYKAGLAKLDCSGTPFRPGRIFYFLGQEVHEPSFCVDISAFWKKKVSAILCYKSQFHNPQAKHFTGHTDLATPAFLEVMEARNRFWGIRIKRHYAEGFVSLELPEIDDITTLGGERFP